MVKPVLASRRSIGFIGEGVRTANQWWLSGGINAANCVAAYQPKGAASYAASKVNLANPGTYDAADGTAYPTWDATNGWKFNAANSQYINTNIIHGQNWSAICKYSNYSISRMLFGARTGTTNTRLMVDLLGAINQIGYGQGTSASYYITQNPFPNSAVLSVAGQYGYKNGTVDTPLITGWSGTNTSKMFIGAYSIDNVAQSGFFLTAYVQAFAIYNTAITDSQVSALTTAMNAL